VRSPFDDPGQDGETHLVLANAAGERSLWPAFAAVPAGWAVALSATSHRACAAYLDRAADCPVPEPSGAPQ
jgi:uncharacterized protein YbdZ (MbtH family)